MFSRKEIQIFLLYFILLSFLTKLNINGANDSSRIATIESLVEHHSFIMYTDVFGGTIDKYFYNGHFYSDKPPALALYGAIFYFILHHIFGLSFTVNPQATYYLLTLLVIGIFSCIGMVYFYKTLLMMEVEENWASALTLVAGAGTLILPYSLVFSNHAISGVLLLLSFYNLLKIKQGEGLHYAALSGLFVSLAGSIDITLFMFIPFYLIPLWGQSKKVLLCFGISCLPVIIVYLLLNVVISGSVIPPAMNAKLWDYPGSAFGKETLSGLAQYEKPSELLNYAFHMLIGNRGFLTYTPVLLFSLFALFRGLSNKGFKYKKEYFFLAITTLVYVALYIFRSKYYGGGGYGIRWYTSLMFLLCLPLGHIISDIKDSELLRRAFIMMAIVSIFITIVGTFSPFQSVIPPSGMTSDSSFINSLYQIAGASPWHQFRLVIAAGAIYYLLYRLFQKVELTLKL